MITRFNFESDRFANYMEFVPYNTTKMGLYNAQELYKGYDHNHPETFEGCYDQVVYRFFLERGKVTSDPLESMTRAIHDHFVIQGIYQLLNCYDKRKVVGVMGGSAMKRTDEAYRNVVYIAKHLTEQGTLMVSGGGPGAMEAALLGAYLAGRDDKDIDGALAILAKAPSYSSEGYMDVSFDVLEAFPHNGDYECLSIPTWLYGHEPTCPFATHIGKLFGNCVREDMLLTVCYGGLIFAPGSAGTMQEIFQEAVQNHYLTLGLSSPMVFLDKKFWTETMPAYTMLSNLMQTGRYKNLLLSITDDPNEVVNTILEFQQ